MKKSMLYTRTGDGGDTSLVGGCRISKSDERLEAYGTVDELNASIGWLRPQLRSDIDRELLGFVQQKLFTVGSFLATDRSVTELRAASRLDPSAVVRLEERIDAIDAELPPLRNFVLPGGAPGAAAAHVSRTVCRRAERAICRVEHETEGETIRRFINRLSDYLFVLSRLENSLAGVGEFFWTKVCK